MKKIQYKFIYDCETMNTSPQSYVDMFIEPCVASTSSWWKSLNVFSTTNKGNYIDHWRQSSKDFENKKRNAESIYNEFNFLDPQTNRGVNNYNECLDTRTAKRCPGILDLFKNSYLVKSPIEIYIEVRNRSINVIHQANYDMMKISMHPEHQYKTSSNNLFEDKISIKFDLPVALKSPCPFIFLPPMFHTKNPIFEVIPGVISDPGQYKLQTLTTHTFLDISKDRDIHIKAGDVIAYLWFTEKTKLVHNPDFVMHKFRRFFNKPHKQYH
jgi:hypothetical protein